MKTIQQLGKHNPDIKKESEIIMIKNINRENNGNNEELNSQLKMNIGRLLNNCPSVNNYMIPALGVVGLNQQ